MRRTGLVVAIFLVLAGLPRWSDEPPPSGPQVADLPPDAAAAVYRLAVHPLYNPAKLIEAYQPLVDYLNQRLPRIRLMLEASRDYGNFEEKYANRRPEFLLPNPWQTLQAMKSGYRVIAMAGDPTDFKGIFVVRTDSDLVRPVDLKGKAVSYPSPTALAACIMPQFFLHQHGVDVIADLDNRYVGSQESSIMNAYLGLTAAGATWPPPWRAFRRDHPTEAASLKVIWETESLVNNSVMARDDVPQSVVMELAGLLVSLETGTEGQAILAGMETARFLPATDVDYEPVRRYISRFEAEVRPVRPP
ncbi:MAG: phosphate/phosphite/phosphonate ABC transporter substrate-binding protein [Methylococcaceae bacterium]|nr:phosphate/phosphite/phosphonate ABC transporter substrate-binding protein [Methylococcaceae bacterium]